MGALVQLTILGLLTAVLIVAGIVTFDAPATAEEFRATLEFTAARYLPQMIAFVLGCGWLMGRMSASFKSDDDDRRSAYWRSFVIAAAVAGLAVGTWAFFYSDFETFNRSLRDLVSLHMGLCLLYGMCLGFFGSGLTTDFVPTTRKVEQTAWHD